MYIQELFENSLKRMDHTDIGTGVTIGDNQVNIIGPDKAGMNIADAIKYIKQYPDGFLHHDEFEEDSFIFMAYDNTFKFWHGDVDIPKPIEDRIDDWDWEEDIQLIHADFCLYNGLGDPSECSNSNIMNNWNYYSVLSAIDGMKNGWEWWNSIRSNVPMLGDFSL